MVVTPEWILSALINETVVPPPFPHRPKKSPLPIPEKEATKASSSIAAAEKSAIQSHILGGSIFAIVNPKAPSRTISYTKPQLESLITTNGGLLLTKQLFEAFKIDLLSAAKNNSTISRKFYVVSCGGYGDANYVKLDPLLAELSKLVKIISVTPIWIKACVGDNVNYNAEEYPSLFQPNLWPIRLLPPNNGLLVSLTGFVDASRYGIIWILREIGAGYTDNLARRNTHLICKDASGKKYEKGVEWGLHVVSLEWLMHVIRFGYMEGCEEEFSLVKEKAALKGVKSDLFLSRESLGVPKQADEKEDSKLPPGWTDLDSSKAPETAPKPDITNTEISSALPLKHPISAQLEIAADIHIEKNATSSTKSSNDVNKRFHSALQSLESNNPTFPRRSQRQRRHSPQSKKPSPSPLTQQSPQSDEEFEQTEAFTLRVDAPVGMSREDSVPMSQVEDAEDNGESQVVWFAERRGR